MPELPEVETVLRGLKSQLVGRRFKCVQVRGSLVIKGDPSFFSRRLTGARVQNVERHGKAVFLSCLSPAAEVPQVLKIHLGMTGQLVFEPASRPLEKHTHVIFQIEGCGEELRYRDIRKFGRLELLASGLSRPLHPDAWLASEAQLFSALRQKRGMAKHALLNQNTVAGLGNIYVDECLHRAAIHPRRNLARLTPKALATLCRAIREILTESISQGGTSFRNYVNTQGGRGGYKSRLQVYGRAGKPCSCGARIRRAVVAGRGTHYCPRCQRPP